MSETAGPAVRPHRLRPGDKVAIVAPAGAMVPEHLDKGAGILRSWGLDVVIGANAHSRHPDFDYLSAPDADRAAELEQAWCDPDVRAVFCGRGGYGSMRLLELLDWTAMAEAGPKLLVGSSDITAVQQVLGPRLGVVTLSGPMAGTGPFADDETAQAHLHRMLFQPEQATDLSGPASEPLVPGRARGITVGGNLSLVVSGRGVPDVPPPPDGAIGLLEDVTEEPYRLDHFLTHLRRSGWFDRLGGLALGSWQDCGPAKDVRAVLEDRVTDLGIPVVWELGFGHCPGQLTVPLGAEVELISVPATVDRPAEARLALTRPALR